VRVGARVTARGAVGEPGKVGLPRDLVAVPQPGIGQAVVPERKSGAAVRIPQGHRDARAVGWHSTAADRLGLFVPGGLVVSETPGKDDQMRRLDLKERPGGLSNPSDMCTRYLPPGSGRCPGSWARYRYGPGTGCAARSRNASARGCNR